MAKGKIDEASGQGAVRAALAGATDRTTTATAVRFLLQIIETRVPGRSVEVRVPPFGAAQCVEGPGHTRGTPPNVIEMDAATWLRLATGDLPWAEGLASGRIHASGVRADLTPFLPLLRVG
ncbi:MULTISPECIES: sterol carrier family protein [Rathayibacter]|uniref:Bacterial SCP orthologue domain-containing protein n=1 Tax=Rathayibacter caricis DSM 15933 TaxID=1328867 RepID=A0A2T4UR19_9MICO|nr:MULTISPECIES: sterol carrier family protein [Rathayibacter]KQQ08807.1 hypothetical protein ASF46_16335 [Rathayibacter sp. Leaf296]KQQ20483.1 hypothetical protein ASF48_07525 [Rathayibacter sp. Leaf299]MCJ1697643.1 sterol carrier family protein [Rathayibacter caricis]OOB90986.1 hypothetical protein B0T42_08480 [Rathayibacter sp. VKM Ac-2630]PTL71963.1 hypothetical protein C1I63_03320 [Rathayibacter caricis DSM 15933]